MKKFNSYVDENNFVHGAEYEVLVNFNVDWNNQQIEDFIQNNLSGIELLEVKDKVAKLLWPLEVFSGEEEIILEMYDLLEQGELGTYEYTKVN